MPQPATPHEALGGSEKIASIVARFYEFMEADPRYAGLRALHADDLAPVRAGLTAFLDAWLGGPKDWFDQGKCVMSLHRPFPIDADIADQWGDAMARAISGEPGLDKELAQAMATRLGQMARAMINRGQVSDAA